MKITIWDIISPAVGGFGIACVLCNFMPFLHNLSGVGIAFVLIVSLMVLLGSILPVVMADELEKDWTAGAKDGHGPGVNNAN